jgi:hypothetical protein
MNNKPRDESDLFTLVFCAVAIAVLWFGFQALGLVF